MPQQVRPRVEPPLAEKPSPTETLSLLHFFSDTGASTFPSGEKLSRNLWIYVDFCELFSILIPEKKFPKDTPAKGGGKE